MRLGQGDNRLRWCDRCQGKTDVPRKKHPVSRSTKKPGIVLTNDGLMQLFQFGNNRQVSRVSGPVASWPPKMMVCFEIGS